MIMSDKGKRDFDDLDITSTSSIVARNIFLFMMPLKILLGELILLIKSSKRKNGRRSSFSMIFSKRQALTSEDSYWSRLLQIPVGVGGKCYLQDIYRQEPVATTNAYHVFVRNRLLKL